MAAITEDVPSYSDALSGPMGETIRNAVELALGGFVSLAARSRGGAAQTPTAPAVDGAYQLGRGEARSGRTVDALLSAYRIGARVSWQEMSSTAVRNGVDADTLARFAELVFAYIDELSAASVAGHNDELATTGPGPAAAARAAGRTTSSTGRTRTSSRPPPSAPTGRRHAR